MDKEQAITLAKKYKEMVAEKLPLKALYLYGSYSKGNHREDSDIDIAVVVDHLSDNYFEDTPLLWKLRRKISILLITFTNGKVIISYKLVICRCNKQMKVVVLAK